jgi:RNA polymerase sigma-70 factor, ECF subfamily
VEVLLQEPEPRIVAAARRGEIPAFEALVRMYQPYVWRLTLHLLGDEQMAADATQNTFLKAFRAVRRFHGRSKFSTWLISIARNCAHDELRQKERTLRVVRAARADPSARPSTRDEGAISEVRDALAHLSVELREPVMLIDMLGFSYREASEVLGVREGTIKSRVHRARSALVLSLEEPQEDAGES